jgi:hypothetical protein
METLYLVVGIVVILFLIYIFTKKSAPPAPPAACVPSCKTDSGAIKNCGDDGCGGSCGTCGASQTCSAKSICVCTPNCQEGQCGSDGCGGQCPCPNGQKCQDGKCVCAPSCTSCGVSDGCGGTCGCDLSQYCNNGQCEDLPIICVPMCSKPGSCGYGDGCGGTCGCPSGKVCQNGTCVCVPSCSNPLICGGDGCGGRCPCPDGMICSAGNCIDPTINSCTGCTTGQACINAVCTTTSIAPPVPQFTEAVFYYSMLDSSTAGVLQWSVDFTGSQYSYSDVEFMLKVVQSPFGNLVANNKIMASFVSKDGNTVYYKNTNDLGDGNNLTYYISSISGNVRSKDSSPCTIQGQLYQVVL